jgi:hypothetical protein
MNGLIKNDNTPVVTTRWITWFNHTCKDTFSALAEKGSELTIKKCLDYPVIQKLEKELPRKEILLSIRSAVLNTALAFKYSENMDISQATLLATDLYDIFRTDSLEDIFLMFKMARQGLLGSNKGRLDHDIIFNLFVPAYLEKKAEERERQIQNEKAGLQKMDENYIMSEKNKIKLDELINRLDAKKEKKESASVINHHEQFISRLPELCKNLSDKELKEQIQKAKSCKLTDAYIIYKKELEQRNEHKKTPSKTSKAGNPTKNNKQGY